MLTALAALEGLSGSALEALHLAPTVEAAFRQLDTTDPELAARLRTRLALTIEQRVGQYLERHGAGGVAAGVALFDRSRRLCAIGPQGATFVQGWSGPSQGAT